MKQHLCNKEFCNEKLPREDHYLCLEHWREKRKGTIDKCPQCGVVYKDAKNSICIECNKKANAAHSRESKSAEAKQKTRRYDPVRADTFDERSALLENDPKAADKRLLFDKQQGKCVYCGNNYLYNELQVEHMIPKVRGGEDNVRNVQLACRRCNQAKGTMTDIEFRRKHASYLPQKERTWAQPPIDPERLEITIKNGERPQTTEIHSDPEMPSDRKPPVNTDKKKWPRIVIGVGVLIVALIVAASSAAFFSLQTSKQPSEQPSPPSSTPPETEQRQVPVKPPPSSSAPPETTQSEQPSPSGNAPPETEQRQIPVKPSPSSSAPPETTQSEQPSSSSNALPETEQRQIPVKPPPSSNAPPETTQSEQPAPPSNTPPETEQRQAPVKPPPSSNAPPETTQSEQPAPPSSTPPETEQRQVPAKPSPSSNAPPETTQSRAKPDPGTPQQSPPPAGTWRGLTVAPEQRCAPYNRRRDYPYSSQSLEPRIVKTLGSIYSPYTGQVFADLKQTHINRIVATSEAHDSGLCAATAETRRAFAADLLNLTLASPEVSGCKPGGKCAYDAAEWLPRLNQCWFADRVVAVRRKYHLTIDRREADALERVLAACHSTALIGPEGAAALDESD